MITVVTVLHDSAAVLAPCLDSLATGLAGCGPWHLVAVDSGSADDGAAIVRRRWPAATVVATANEGYGASINRAVAAAGRGTGAILVLNPDVRLTAGSVPALEATRERTCAGVVVPQIRTASGDVVRSLRRDPTVGRALAESLLGGPTDTRRRRFGEVVSDLDAYRRPHAVDWASGAVMLIDRGCFDDVGGFDPSFFLYSEETDFARRARDKGWAVRYEPRARTVHLGGESHDDPRLWSLLTTNRVRAFSRWHTPVRTAAFRGALLLGETLRAARGATTHRAAAAALLRPLTPLGTPPTVEGLRPRPRPDVVCFSGQDWWYHNRAHSDFQLMTRIGRDHRVLLVNSIGMRLPRPGRSSTPWRRIARKARSTAKLLRRPRPDDAPGFHVLTPVLLPFYGSPVGRRLNTAVVGAQVRAACRYLGIEKPSVVVTIPTAWPVVRTMDTGPVVFNHSDRHSAFREADRSYIRDLELALLEHADHVVYVSRALLEDEAPLTGDRAVMLDHGVDLDLFTPRDDEPDDLAAIARPRVGYFGGLNDYQIDLTLLERVADDLPDAQIVLIGHADVPIADLTSRPNVHALGRRPHDQIPRYGSGFDVAVMPWQRNEWIRFANPIKLKEYLALGLPVVSTEFPEIHAYGGLVHVAADGEDFVAAVRDALVRPDAAAAAARRAAVQHDTWDARAAELLELLRRPRTPPSAPPATIRVGHGAATPPDPRFETTHA